MANKIPGIISVDVEPAGFQLHRDGASSVAGIEAAMDLVGDIRASLAAATGRSPSFGWYFRMDPQIAVTYGRADHLAHLLRRRVSDLRDAGDHVGLHTHMLRWDEPRQTWVHDVDDPAWIEEVLSSAFAAFELAFGVPCARHRCGGAAYNQATVEALARMGATVDLGLEPVGGSVAHGHDIKTGIDAAPMTGPSADCRGAPRHAYRPSPGDFLTPGPQQEGLTLLPATTTRLRPPGLTLRTAAVAATRGRLPTPQMLYMDRALSPKAYWDLVSRQLRLMRRPYLNLALRTDPPGSEQLDRATALLHALADHPVARRLEIVDPLEALPVLLGEKRAFTSAA